MLAEGYALLSMHLLLQRTDGGVHTYADGLLSKEAVNLSVQVNPRFDCPSTQAGVLCSG